MKLIQLMNSGGFNEALFQYDPANIDHAEVEEAIERALESCKENENHLGDACDQLDESGIVRVYPEGVYTEIH